ncbi:MAG: hypothetical protein JNJ83_11345 [Verrucomicrobiaceae bacterium]|nr:hypothetical protein [Verrucomicrobiaceae bacterium]
MHFSSFVGRLCLRFGLSSIICASASAQLVPLIGQNAPITATGSPIIIQTSDATTSEAPPVASREVERVTKSSPGPWGQLDYFHVYLEAPDFLVDKFPLPNTQTRWIFPLSLQPELKDVLARCGMSPAEIEVLMAAPGHTELNEKSYYFPPRDLIETLAPEVRGKVYKILSRVPDNEFHAEPVLFVSGDIDHWYRTSALKPDKITLIKKLSYMRGDILAFSDIALLMADAQSEAEAKSILKCMTRTRSLVVKLIVDEKSDIPSLMGYWTTGMNTRRKDALPMLESVVSIQGAEKLDIMHMLPALPRKLLLTYPDMSLGLDGLFPDCHWTSLNFFNYKEQPYLLDPRLATTAVLERFGMIDSPYKFGDIIFFLDSERGDAFHSCVYLADDIVFTKNGRNLLSPWILMKLDDVKRIYLHDGNGRVQGFRNKNAISMIEGQPTDASVSAK